MIYADGEELAEFQALEAKIKVQAEQIDQAKSLITGSIEKIKRIVIAPVSLGQLITAELCKALTLLEQAKQPEFVCPNCSLTGEQAKLPHSCWKLPTGEFRKECAEIREIYLQKPYKTIEAAHWLVKRLSQQLAKAGDLLDALEAENKLLKSAQMTELAKLGTDTAYDQLQEINPKGIRPERIEP